MTTKGKPPKVRRGYYWKHHSSGWDAQKDVYVEVDGVRKRRQIYLGHLSRSAFDELKRGFGRLRKMDCMTRHARLGRSMITVRRLGDGDGVSPIN